MSLDMCIPAEELYGALEDTVPCPDCAGGLGIHVEDDWWDVVRMHNIPCPVTSGQTGGAA